MYPYARAFSVGGAWGGPHDYEGKVGDGAMLHMELKMTFETWLVGAARGTGTLYKPIGEFMNFEVW